MRITFKTFLALPALFAAAAMLTACGNVSQNIAKDGRSAEALVWPSKSDVTPMHKGGSFPGRDSLAVVHVGLNKQQIAGLIGYPHFSEGVWGVREWNYVFNFHEPVNSENLVTCQFKVLFDEARVAQSFYWLPAGCARFMNPVPVPANTQASQVPMATEKFTISVDALFAFDRFTLTDITGNGRAQLQRFANSLKARGNQVQFIRISGYTDRLGGDAYNNELSQRRADTIKGYLANQGIQASLISAQGMGKQDPVKDCAESDQASLISCLAPNRRVEILVTSIKAASGAG